jgi:hypothetical protein
MSSIKEYSEVLLHLLPLMSLETSQLPGHSKPLRSAVDALARLHNIGRYFEDLELHGELQSVVYEVLSVEKSSTRRETLLDEKLSRLVTQLRSKVGNWTIVVPVDNLLIESKRRLDVGNVTFFCFSRRHSLRTLAQIKDILMHNPHYANNPKLINRLLKDSGEHHLNPLIGKTCAKTVVFGREENAFDDALFRIEEALAGLKLFRYTNDDFYARHFGIQGTVISEKRRPMLYYSEKLRHIGFRSDIMGALFRFEVDAERIRFMRTRGFRKLNHILAKQHRTDVEDRIISSALWFARATDVILSKSTRIESPFQGLGGRGRKKRLQSEMMAPYDRLLKLFVSLETLLLFDEHEPIASNLAQRTAILVGADYPRRRNIVKFVKEMYKKRSGVIHHGGKDILESELQELMYLTQTAITTLLSRSERMRVSSNDSLREWFEKKILA